MIPSETSTTTEPLRVRSSDRATLAESLVDAVDSYNYHISTLLAGNEKGQPLKVAMEERAAAMKRLVELKTEA